MQKIDKERQGMDVEVSSFISQAIEQKAPVETMERLFALREKVKAERAREEYVSALGRFQSQCPIIEKTSKVLNKDGRTVRYTFAPLDSIVRQIRELVTACDLSYTWDVVNTPGSITVVCKVTHVLGHSDSSTFSVPIDTEGYMTAPQKVASALTFAKRYSMCNVLGISTGDEDTDATDVGKENTAKSIKAQILFLLRALGQKTATAKDIKDSIKELTKLDASDDTYQEIASRLELLVSEKNENATV